MDSHCELAIHVIKELGGSAQPIPESSSKTADLDASLGGVHFLVEVKQCRDDESLAELLDGNGKVASTTYRAGEVTSPTNHLKTASKQLRSSGSSRPDHLRIAWLENKSVIHRRWWLEDVHTMCYGVMGVIWADPGDAMQSTRCLFTEYPILPRHSAIDAVIATDIVDQDICIGFYVNPRSTQYERVRTLPLREVLGKGFFDPGLVSLPEWVKSDLPGSASEDELKSHLSEKYNRSCASVYRLTRYQAFAHTRRA